VIFPRVAGYRNLGLVDGIPFGLRKKRNRTGHLLAGSLGGVTLH